MMDLEGIDPLEPALKEPLPGSCDKGDSCTCDWRNRSVLVCYHYINPRNRDETCRGCGATPGSMHDPFCATYLTMKQMRQSAPEDLFKTTDFVHKQRTQMKYHEDYATLDNVINTIRMTYDEQKTKDLTDEAVIGQLVLAMRGVEDSANYSLGNLTKEDRLLKVALAAIYGVISLRVRSTLGDEQ